MKTYVVNIKDYPTPKFDIYIGRENQWLGLEASKWANPYILKRESDRSYCLERYSAYIMSRPDLLRDMRELDGKILGCYCFPRRCHGMILIELRDLQLKGQL